MPDYRGAKLNADGTTGHWFPWTEKWAQSFEKALGNEVKIQSVILNRFTSIGSHSDNQLPHQ